MSVSDSAGSSSFDARDSACVLFSRRRVRSLPAAACSQITVLPLVTAKSSMASSSIGVFEGRGGKAEEAVRVHLVESQPIGGVGMLRVEALFL